MNLENLTMQTIPWGGVATGAVVVMFLIGFLAPIAPLAWTEKNQKNRKNRERQEPGLRLSTRISLLCAFLGGLIVTVGAAYVLVTGQPYVISIRTPEASIAGMPPFVPDIRIDLLAAFFLFLIGALSLCVTFYSFAYLTYMSRPYARSLNDEVTTTADANPPARSEEPALKRNDEKWNDESLIAASYNLFVLAGVSFVAANNIFFFVVSIEILTLAFTALVLHKQFEEPENPAHWLSPKIYLIANHIGGVLIAVALLMLAFRNAAHPTFTISDLGYTENDGTRNVIFLLLLSGFGVKAGVIPFHVWVAIAHPSSPTNTHAMSLGIMIKIAIYGMIRFFFQALGAPPWWWGMLLLLVAACTAVVSVNNALRGQNLKAALADHSVENIGIILVGVGLALLFSSNDWHGALPTPAAQAAQTIAAVALVAGLFHLLNHTIFKGLLYLCTGAIEYVTGITVRKGQPNILDYGGGRVWLDRLGGIIHRWGVLAACFLVGSVAIAGLPPFNGFISEWLLLQALIAGIVHLAISRGLSGYLLVGIIGLVVATVLLVGAFALTAMAFVKIAGEAILGSLPPELRRPRKNAEEIQKRSRVPKRMLGPTILLAALCLIVGLIPVLILPKLREITQSLGRTPLAFSQPARLSSLNYLVPNLANRGVQTVGVGDYLSWALPLVIAIVALIIVAALLVNQRRRQPSPNRMSLRWIGGAIYNRSAMKPTTASYTFLIRRFLVRDFMYELIAPIHQLLTMRHRWQVATSRIIAASRSGPLPTPVMLASPDDKAGKPADDKEAKTHEEESAVSSAVLVPDRFRQCYNLAIALVRAPSDRVSAVVQNGDVRNYLLYIFGLFIIALFVLMMLGVGL